MIGCSRFCVIGSKWLNRKSQRKTYTWAQLNQALASVGWPKPAYPQRPEPISSRGGSLIGLLETTSIRKTIARLISRIVPHLASGGRTSKTPTRQLGVDADEQRDPRHTDGL
jgi:hypothetical protein